MSKSCIYSDALLIERAAFLLRHEMLKCKTKFEGHFQQDYVNNCVPNQLIHFFESCLTGIKVGSEDLKPSKEEHTLAQLCQFNCHQSYKKDALFHRHSPQKETAFPVYLGLSVYSKYRKEALVDLLFDHGLSISYDRVLEISNSFGESVIQTYERNGVICPLNLKKGNIHNICNR